MVTCFLIPGAPKGKGRPRYASAGRKPYTPQATRSYEQTVRLLYLSATEAGKRTHGGAVRVCIDAAHEVPKSWSKAKRLAALRGEIPAAAKPDADNIAKIILDALNGLAYTDDKMVIELHVRKRYAECGHVAVRIEDMEE